MQTDLLNIKGESQGKVDLPKIFSLPFRPDLINRVYLIMISHNRQRQGRDPEAGERTSAESWGTGRGAARMARAKGAGSRRANQAAGVASVVGGRIPHPPRAEKKIKKYVNRKERRLAIALAIAASSNQEIVKSRGHKINAKSFPIVINDDIEKINKTNELLELVQRLNLDEDLQRILKTKKLKSGKARMRGRTTRIGKGPLIVIAKDRGIRKSVSNVPGVECVLAEDLSVTDLAPGSHPGRLVIWSKTALGEIPKEILGIGDNISN
jgi:large subunit ribosomal protein L4e